MKIIERTIKENKSMFEQMMQMVVKLKQNRQIQDYIELAKQTEKALKVYLKLKAIKETGKIVIDSKARKIVSQTEVLESKLKYQLAL